MQIDKNQRVGFTPLVRAWTKEKTCKSKKDGFSVKVRN